MIKPSGSKIVRNTMRVKAFYYSCKRCGNGITSEEYYAHGLCYRCRWL